MAEIDVDRNLVAPLRVGIVGIGQHLQVDETQQRGVGQDEVVVLVSAILDEAKVGFGPVQTVPALGISRAPPRRGHLVRGVIVKGDIPHAEPAAFANDRAVEHHPKGVRRARLAALQHRIGRMPRRRPHLQPQVLRERDRHRIKREQRHAGRLVEVCRGQSPGGDQQRQNQPAGGNAFPPVVSEERGHVHQGGVLKECAGIVGRHHRRTRAKSLRHSSPFTISALFRGGMNQ